VGRKRAKEGGTHELRFSRQMMAEFAVDLEKGVVEKKKNRHEFLNIGSPRRATERLEKCD